jgi:ribosomal protein S18 acetylase RimI-like enzyme
MPGFETLEENLRATLCMFARARNGGEIRNLPGLMLASSGVQFAMFNSALLTAPVADAAELEDRIARSAAFFSAQTLPWCFWICEDWLIARVRREARHLLWKNGLHLVVELPGMAAEQVLPDANQSVPLEFRRVGDAWTRMDFNHVMSVVFGIPLPVSSEIYSTERLWNTAEFAGYVGYLSGYAVCTAATMLAGGAVGVYGVATLPAHRRKGYGEAIVRHAIEEASGRSGISRTVLESSAAGFRLYERMGYRTVTRYAAYASD